MCHRRSQNGIGAGMIQYIIPNISRQQAYKSFKRTVFTRNKGILKTKTVVDQRTTTKLLGITVKQQLRWFKCYNGVLDQLRHVNTGNCNKTVKTFGELIHHFDYGGEETCFQACGNGKAKGIDSLGRKNHDNKDIK